MPDITKRLLPDPKKTDELEVFLATRGDAEQSEPGTIKFEGGQLTVEYSKKHKIKSITVADSFSEAKFSSLESDAKQALSENPVDVRRRHLHCYSPIVGYYRHQNEFQILPPSLNDPLPDFSYAEHPMLLEYSFPQSPHQHVNEHRSSRRFSELSLLLNALVRWMALPRSSSSDEWVKPRGAASQYCQLGYFGGKDDRARGRDQFTVSDGLEEISLVGANDYYQAHGLVSGSSMVLPDSFTESVNSYFALDESNRESFCRASYWLHVANRVFATSRSAAFAAMVSAIEVLLPPVADRCERCGRPTSDETCQTCKQPSAGPSKMFREFVDSYAPGVPERDRKKMYNTRSSLSHGDTLFPGDLSEMGFRFTAQNNEAQAEHDLLSHVVQIALVNWLQNPS